MDNAKRRIIVGIFIFIFLSSGCFPSTGEERTPSRSISSSITTIDSTPSPWQEKTTIPSYQTKIVPSITITPSQTVAPTDIPTLSVENANQTLLSLLTSNAGCRLPCLWGITPGRSLSQNALTILWPLRSISELTQFEPGYGYIAPIFTEGDLFGLTTLVFLTEPNNEIIKYISLKTGSFRKFWSESFASGYSYSEVFDIPAFGKIVAIYMLPGILSEYGRPDSVLILTYGGPPGDFKYNYFEMVLLYSDQGILVHYTTQKRMVGNNILGCMANAHVELELVPSGNGDSFMDLISSSSQDALPYYKPVKELTSMSVDDFYQAFRQPTDKCITIPNKLLPTLQR
jgi:hypothetical protein